MLRENYPSVALFDNILSYVLTAFVVFAFAITAKGAVTLTATPSSRTVNAGQATSYTININRNGYGGNITFGATNLPSGVTASFSPTTTTGKSSSLTVTTKTTTPAGSYQLKIIANASGINIAAIQVTLVVKPVPSVSLTTIPSTLSIIAGQNAAAEVLLSRTNYEGPVLLSASNLPDGVSVSFDQNPASGDRSTMRIYSPGLPHLGEEFSIDLLAESNGAVTRGARISVRVNCGLEWVEQFGTPQNDINPSGTTDTYQSLTVDANGNIYVAGDTFEPGLGSEVWVAKYDSAGQQQWFMQFGTPGEYDDRVLEVAVDSSGKVFLGGYTNGTFPGNTNNQNSFDFWIAKLDGSGTQPVQEWIRQSGGPQEDGANGFEIIPDDLGGGTLTTFIDDREQVSTYSFRSNDGRLTQLWTVDFNTSQQQRPYNEFPWDLALGPNNTLVIVGNYFNQFNSAVAYLLVFDTVNGNELAEETFSVQDHSVARRVIVDDTGKIYVAGNARDLNPPGQTTSAWVRIYDQNYAHVQNFIDSQGDDAINAVALDANGDLIVAGKTTGVLGETNGDSPGQEDAWVARLHGGTADLVWLRQFPVSGADGFEGAAVVGNGGIVLTGFTSAFKAPTGSRDAVVIRYQASITSQFEPFISNLTDPLTGQILNSAAVGATVRINGGNFGLLGNPPVRFNGSPAMSTRLTSRVIEAIVPAAARNTTGYVTVTNNCECIRSPGQFTVLP